jgi:hypothetical protein
VSARPRVYIAHPLSTYGTLHERRSLAALRRLLPGVRLLNPAAMFASSPDWLERWPDVLDGIDALVVVPDEGGAVGAGVVRELCDAHGVLVPVALFNPGTEKLHRLARLDFPPVPNPWDAGRPVAGEALTWELASRPRPRAGKGPNPHDGPSGHAPPPRRPKSVR